METPYWTNRLCRPDDTDAVLALVRAVHGREYPELDRSYWEWRYLSDAGFCADVFMAECDGRPIGILPVAVFEFQWGEQRLKGVILTGLLTHPDHRRRGVFRSLVNSINEHAARQGALFLMGMPNEPSLPGYKKFEWEYPGLIPLYVKALNIPAVLRAKAGRLAVDLVSRLPQRLFSRHARDGATRVSDSETTNVVPDELDQVFNEFALDCGGLMIRRTTAYWRWRYGAKPASVYRTLLAQQAGRMMGVVATTVQKRMGLRVGMVLDVVTSGGTAGVRRLLQDAQDDMHSGGVGLITCQATSALLQHALEKEGYYRPDPKWLPKRFHFVYRTTGIPGLPGQPKQLADWHLTFGDSDNI